MGAASVTKIFISYAHRDAAELAQRLQRDLNARHLDAWLDTDRLHGGKPWTKEIERAIDEAEVALALLSPGSYTSDICLAEQVPSLRKGGKCVIPLPVRKSTKIPRYFETKQWLDFSDSAQFRATSCVFQ
jgi:hypothetical protein